MKKILRFTMIIFLMDLGSCYAQEPLVSETNHKIYKIWIKTNTDKIKGYLYTATEEGISISKTTTLDLENIVFIPAAEIKHLKIRRKGAVAKGSLIGGVAGSLLGYWMGISEGDDEPGWFSYSKEEKANYGAFVLGIPGGIIGAVIGSSRNKIHIDYNLEKYRTQLRKIEVYAMFKRPQDKIK